MSQRDETLKDVIASDPAVLELYNKKFPNPGGFQFLTAEDLRSLGYTSVPDDWKFGNVSPRGGRGKENFKVYRENDRYDKVLKAAAGTLAAVGGGLAIAGGSAAGSAAGAAEGVIPSTSIPGLHAAVPGGTAASGGGLLARIGSKVWDNLDLIPDVMAGGADAMGANRDSALNAEHVRELVDQQRQRDYKEYSLKREQDRQTGGKTAFREAQHADYVASGGRPYTPKDGLPSYGFGPKAKSTRDIAAAETYRTEQQKRIDAGDSLLPEAKDPGTYAFDASLTQPSKTEKTLGYGSLLARLLGLAKETK